MTQIDLIHARDLAPQFGVRITSWAKLRKRLEAQTPPFPQPVHGLWYDPAAVRAWLDARIPAELRPPPAPTPPAAPVEGDDAAQRAAGLCGNDQDNPDLVRERLRRNAAMLAARQSDQAA